MLTAAATTADFLDDLAPGTRTLLGIAGAPGAGKSTLAADVVERARAAGVRTALVPMNGFHLAQEVLDARGLGAVKGAPETFDAAGFLALLARLRERPAETVWAPTFDRDLEQPVAGAIEVAYDVELVVTEGNYLLLQQSSWSLIAGLLDESWFLDPPGEDVRRQRLLDRHVAFGDTLDHARERVEGSDERNARLVRATRLRADIVIDGG